LKSWKENKIQAWWYMPVTPGPRRLRQEDGEFEASGLHSKILLQKTPTPLKESLKKDKKRILFCDT
jgi:hypothetical protein